MLRKLKKIEQFFLINYPASTMQSSNIGMNYALHSAVIECEKIIREVKKDKAMKRRLKFYLRAVCYQLWKRSYWFYYYDDNISRYKNLDIDIKMKNIYRMFEVKEQGQAFVIFVIYKYFDFKLPYHIIDVLKNESKK